MAQYQAIPGQTNGTRVELSGADTATVSFTVPALSEGTVITLFDLEELESWQSKDLANQSVMFEHDSDTAIADDL
jgi:hypothetical protein